MTSNNNKHPSSLSPPSLSGGSTELNEVVTALVKAVINRVEIAFAALVETLGGGWDRDIDENGNGPSLGTCLTMIMMLSEAKADRPWPECTFNSAAWRQTENRPGHHDGAA